MSDPERDHEFRTLWRSLGERDTPRAASEHSDEFPPEGSASDEELSRRDFVGLLGASLAASTIAGCRRAPEERIVPYARVPREVTPGVANHYASSFVLDGYAIGVLVESHEGRPTKIEGNPEHPASLGASDALMQAAVLGLYDPDRARSVLHRGVPASYDAFVTALTASPSTRTHVLMEPTTSPTLIDLVARIRRRFPLTRFHVDAPLATMGRTHDVQLDLARARVIVSFGDDLLAAGPMHLRYARDFAAGRTLVNNSDAMNRLYVVESAPTVTGFAADHRLRARPREMLALANALLGAVRGGNMASGLGPRETRWTEAVARDLLANRGACVVTAGDAQSPEVHGLVRAINAALGNAQQTVRYTERSVLHGEGITEGLASLTAALYAGEVDTLIVLEGNPVYAAPVDLGFANAMQRARTTAYLGLYRNETAHACEWHVNAAHWLESWGDARALDGTVSFVQPLLAPLYDGKTASEVLAHALLGDRNATAHALVQSYWRARDAHGFEARWESDLQRGFSTAPTDLAPAALDTARISNAATPTEPAPGLEIAFVRDARVYDGRFANNPWLQELPDPVSKLTWENAALVSPATGLRLGLANDDRVRLTVRDRHVDATVLVIPGHADDVVTLPLGYGRRGDESIARERGTNAYALRCHDALWHDAVRITKLPGNAPLALTQEHWSMEGRDPVREYSLAEYRRNARVARGEGEHRDELLYRLPVAGTHQWGMAIDLTRCTGCSACVIACQAENNIPSVGKEGVRRSREMHWLRLDRYFVGSSDEPRALMQPMMCQHCESAPCEYVCPVNATVHSPDGLNEQVYNRCVGTRFCSSNCPYKVRRFNYFDYQRDRTDGQRMAMNPDVTVRARGVMEKCTYCVQRLRRAEIDARRAQRPLRDVPVTTACAQACPSRAIAFGLVSERESEVARMHRNERAYGVLAELGTLPRTRYLARIRNVNPELASEGES